MGKNKTKTYGSELGGTLSDQLVDVLAVEFRDELLKAVLICINADRAEYGLDVFGAWGGVTAELKEEVGSDMAHSMFFWKVKSA